MKYVLLPLLLLTLAACSTVEGAGQDISTAGDFVTDSAQSVEKQF